MERFLPRVETFFRIRVANPEWVEDLTQETIVAALIALRSGKLRDYEAMEYFVLGIARRQLAEALRVKARDPASPAGEEIGLAQGSPILAPELRLSVRNELDHLGATDQRILWLILVEGFRLVEVAAQLGLSEDAIRQRKSRLLRRLAEKFSAAAVTNPDLAATIQTKSISSNTP